MNENNRRAVAWETIERIAFRPASYRDCLTWLAVYARTLHILWGLEPLWIRFGLNDEFIVNFLNLRCAHIIESESKFSIKFFVNNSTDCLNLEVDPNFDSKTSLQICAGKYPQDQMNNYLASDVEAVLEGMIFHPRCHIHLDKIGIQHTQLDQEMGGLSSHEIRVGGGIENPFVFLFHLRYQFCLQSYQVRETERQRLIALFQGAIKEKSIVNARELFNFKS